MRLLALALLASCQITTDHLEIGAHYAPEAVGYAGVRHEVDSYYMDAGLGVTPLTDQDEDDHRAAWFYGAGWLYPLSPSTRLNLGVRQYTGSGVTFGGVEAGWKHTTLLFGISFSLTE